jgi:hypothetical protein
MDRSDHVRHTYNQKMKKNNCFGYNATTHSCTTRCLYNWSGTPKYTTGSTNMSFVHHRSLTIPISISRSKRPGLRNAGSIAFGRLVAASTTMRGAPPPLPERAMVAHPTWTMTVKNRERLSETCIGQQCNLVNNAAWSTRSTVHSELPTVHCPLFHCPQM